MTKPTLTKINNYITSHFNHCKDTQHDLHHVLRVTQNALKIAKIVDVNHQIDLNLLKATCLLHDLTYLKYQTGIFTYLFEGLLVRKPLKRAFRQLSIAKEDRLIIFNAVIKHPYSFPFKRLRPQEDLYTQVLQDADTLDIFIEFRKQTLIQLKKNTFLYKPLKRPAEKLFIYGKNNLANFLNYPQILTYFYD